MNTPNRNDPCPCGSGKKYKQCCLKRDEGLAAGKRSDMASVAKDILAAMEHHQAGRLPQAEAIYQKILQIEPNHPDALHFLGVIALQAGKDAIAIELIGRAIHANPSEPMYYTNLGTALEAQGRLDEAAACHNKALALKPNYADAHGNLGAVLYKQGKLDEAVACYRKALELKPDFAGAHCHLGVALRDQGRLDEAVRHHNKALSLNPDFAEAHNHLGVALKDQGRLDEATEHYHKALSLKPDYADAHSNLGFALQLQGRLDEAVERYHKALSLKPDFAVAHSNLGLALQDQGSLEEAVMHYRKALSIKPDFAVAHSNLLFTLNLHADERREEILAVCREYDEQFCLPHRNRWPAHSNSREPDRRLRIGYVSPDFRRHAVAYFAEPILANHDKSQVEIFCYAEVRKEDEVTGRFRHLADQWHSTLGLNDDAAAKMIRGHQIDILVDLTGHTAGNRLPVFARKPAPLQLTYLGYPGTTGLSAMDYRITDHHADPEGMADACYTEHLLRLPHSLWCYRPSTDMPEISVLPALARGYLTFGSFNNFNKIEQPTLDLWADLLRALPTSRLMMLTVPEGDARARLQRSFAELGIDAYRLEFHGKLPGAEFHRKFLEVDITLDPITVNGATTTCESLWMGVPVISLTGTRFLTRAGLSILNTAGLADFAAASPEDYIRIAHHLAGNLPLLAEIRAGLRAHVAASPLIDEAGFTRNMENLYREIWGKWCRAT